MPMPLIGVVENVDNTRKQSVKVGKEKYPSSDSYNF